MSQKTAIVYADGSVQWTRDQERVEKLLRPGKRGEPSPFIRLNAGRIAMIGAKDLEYAPFRSGSGAAKTPKCRCERPGHQCGPTLTDGATLSTFGGQDTMQLRKRKARTAA